MTRVSVWTASVSGTSRPLRKPCRGTRNGITSSSTIFIASRCLLVERPDGLVQLPRGERVQRRDRAPHLRGGQNAPPPQDLLVDVVEGVPAQVREPVERG